ncbi:uncharacterized protein I303_103003 [Kwoniella dejecticola CBS 10117]|uniref:SET domain-containing protein n=1 Tax=Kwoniella dejecticola CBS 10117 TaxID=1296121 RepID=A0A1A6AAC0_9TREE|nr:uncharacterized protein I303_03022 [Kwoniella dejecticola CBS 10117]OBR87000.1 hypothetical protein I303_03022 [Kwoniella dejecticola CBS 10117]
MEDISNGLEPYPIPLKDGDHLGSFQFYNADSIFSDDTPITSYSPLITSRGDEDNEDQCSDMSTEEIGSPGSQDPSESSDSSESSEPGPQTCACSADQDGEETLSLCTVKQGNACDCVSSFGNFYPLPSRKSGNDQNQVLHLDALPDNLPLVECSPHCPCAGSCANKLTQRGVRVPVAVEPSTSGIGLGLFHRPADAPVHTKLPRGTFVSLYAGEYLTTLEARQRWAEQAIIRIAGEGNYILSLRLPGETWHIDPRYKGNVGRFLNHSCDPNCVIQVVRWGTDSLPRAAIFTKRDIQAGEELTFDYANASGSPELASKLRSEGFVGDQGERTKCLCGTQLCREWMPFDETL